MMRNRSGFTLIEILVVVVLLGIVAIIAVPQFIDLRTEARDETTKAAVGNFRAAVAMMVGAVVVKEDPKLNPTTYPTFAEVSGNQMLAAAPGNHAKLAGTPLFEKGSGIPINPWTGSNTVHNCDATAKGTLLAAPNADDGWCYNQTTGELWANSDLSRGSVKENTF